MKKTIWGLLILVLLPGWLSAESLVLTIDKAVDLALESNLGLKSNRIDLEMKKRAAGLSWNKFIPTIQASGTLMRWNKEQSGSILQGNPLDPLGPGVYGSVIAGSYDLPRWGLSAGLDISLNLSYALFEEIKGTKNDYEAGQISYETALKKLERDVRKNFYNILVFKENLKLMEENINAAHERYKQAEINFKNGLVPELSMLSAQVGWENLKPSLMEMKLGSVTMMDGFKMLLGVNLKDTVELTGALDIEPVTLNADKLSAKFLSGRMDIRSLNNTIQGLKIRKAALQLRTMTPALVLGLNFDPAFQNDPLEKNWFEDMKDNWIQQSGMLRLTLAFSIDSMLPWSSAQSGIKDMTDGINKAEIGLAQARTGAEMEIKTLVMKLNKSVEQLKTLGLNVNLADRAYRMSQDAYKAGSKDLLEVQDSQRNLNTAKLEVLKEKFNYITGMLDLEYALNATFTEIKETEK